MYARRLCGVLMATRTRNDWARGSVPMNTKRSNETFCMISRAVDVFVYSIDMRKSSLGH
jgi:hypothetical protein